MKARSDTSPLDALRQAWESAQRHDHRLLITLCRSDAVTYACELFRDAELNSLLPRGELLTLGAHSDHPLSALWPDRAHAHLSWSSARARLGGDEAGLLIDGSEGLQPDALAAALGVVRGGGLILLCLPEHPPERGALKEQLAVWPTSIDAVGHRMWSLIWRSLTSSESTQLVGRGMYITHAASDSTRSEADHVTAGAKLDFSSLSPALAQLLGASPAAQQVIINAPQVEAQRSALLTALTSHYREAFTAVALSAQRGRGKSSTLGMIAATLLLLGEGEVGVTAPSLYAVGALFERAQAALEEAGITAHLSEGSLTSTAGVIRYWSPQQLWTRQARPSTLLVDEAASLPVPLLERLLERRPSLIFATTTHGYEGTGRGFSLRFRPLLQRRLRKLYEPKLTEPLRWSDGDPVEAWMMSALALDVDLSFSRDPLDLSLYRYEQITADALSSDSTLRREVFALLVHAHYRTQPSDLWRILDAPNLTIHLLRRRNGEAQRSASSASSSSHDSTSQPTIVAVAITSAEGALPPELAARVYEGRVRPRGQLFAANLAVHLSCEEGAQLRLERVVRIATRPDRQGRGAGSALLTAIEGWAREQSVDLLGSSFGATDQLSRFWFRAGFAPLRVGVRQSHVSGERSLLVARGLNDSARALVARLMSEHDDDLSEQLRGPLSSLDPQLLYTLCASICIARPPERRHALSAVTLTRRQWETLGAVAFAGRAYELALGPARTLALAWLMDAQRAEAYFASAERGLTPLGRLLITKVIQGQRWLEVTADAQVGSTSEAMKGLSAALRVLYLRAAPEWARVWAQRFPQYQAPAQLCAQLMPLDL